MAIDLADAAGARTALDAARCMMRAYFDGHSAAMAGEMAMMREGRRFSAPSPTKNGTAALPPPPMIFHYANIAAMILPCALRPSPRYGQSTTRRILRKPMPMSK